MVSKRYHRLFSKIKSLLLNSKKAFEGPLESLIFTILFIDYSIILATLPEPTVLPPSRIISYLSVGNFPLFKPLFLNENVGFYLNSLQFQKFFSHFVAKYFNDFLSILSLYLKQLHALSLLLKYALFLLLL